MFSAILPWFVNLELLGLLSFPLTFAVCTRLYDRGYGLSKALGLILTCYLAWLLANIGNPGAVGGKLTARILGGGAQFSYLSVAYCAAAVGVFSFISAARNSLEILRFMRLNWKLILGYELIFVAAFGAMILLRAQVPEIMYQTFDPGQMKSPGITQSNFLNSAAEKFTDFAVLNGMLTSSNFPPHDAWLSGQSMNYYYFGHFLWACMIKFSSVPAGVGFNLALASIFALVCVQSFSLGFNLTRRVGWGLLAMFLIAMAGNLDGFLQLIGIATAGILDPASSRFVSGGRAWYLGFDFWRSSRSIENTINEFPAFSFLLGDLHAHLSSLVILLAGFGLAIQAWRNAASYKSLFRYELHNLDELFFCALIAGALFAANSWDAVTFGAVLVAALWSGRSTSIVRADPATERGALASLLGIECALLGALVIMAGIGGLFLPYTRNFTPPMEAGSAIKWVTETNRSDPSEYLGHWALVGFAPTLLVTLLLLRRCKSSASPEAREKFWALVSLFVAAVFALGTITQGWVAAATAVIALGLFITLVMVRRPPSISLILGFLFVFFALSCVCELWYVDDIFDGTIERINTVFKIYYGLWPIMVLAAILSLRLLIRFFRLPAWGLLLPLVLVGSAYPIAGTAQRVGTRLKVPAAKSADEALDGLRFMKYANADDMAAVEWIGFMTKPDTVFLEATGTQYDYNGRISTMTGRPSFGGWLYHEWGWRGPKWVPERDRRIDAAQTIYTTHDARAALTLLRENHIQYIVVGRQERSKYPAIDEAIFPSVGELVFRSGETSIYKVDYDAQLPELAARESVEIPMQPDSGGTTETKGEEAPTTETKVEESWTTG